MKNPSRAEYYRKRRETIGQFNVPIPRNILEALDKKLKEENITKTDWLMKKILEELEPEEKK